MLHLLLQAGLDRYALEVNQVVEVLPLVHLHPLPQAPRGVIGAFHFHGTPVSVIDLSLSLTGHPTPSRLSTRLVVVERPAPGSGGKGERGSVGEREKG